MHSLLTALIEREAFADDTIVTANYKSIDLFGRIFSRVEDFRVKNILRSSEKIQFELITLKDGSFTITANPEEICAIDGMDIFRYADIYDILPDGSSKKVGRKRGRKPKK